MPSCGGGGAGRRRAGLGGVGGVSLCGNESAVGVAVAADDRVLATGEHWNVTAVDCFAPADALVGVWKLSLAENTMRRKFRIIIV